MFRWYQGVIARGGEGWQTGDWLINYAGGLVRRGAVGESLFRVLPSEQVLEAVFWIQVGFLFVFCSLSVFLFLKSPRSGPWFALTLSPAFLLFPFLSPEGGLRKELIGLTALAWLAVAIRMKWAAWTRLPALLLFAIGLSGHEVTVLMLPAFAFLLFQEDGLRNSSAWTRIEAVAYAAIGVLALVFYALRPGSSEQVSAICQSWQEYGIWSNPDTLQAFCNSAVGSLGDTTLEAVKAVAANFPGYLSLVSLFVLASVPFYLIRIPRSIVFFAAVQFVALVPLFVVGTDYGRWFFVFFSITSLIVLSLSTRLASRTRGVPNWAAVLYVSLWSIPYAGTPTGWSLFSQVTQPLYQSIAEQIVRMTPWLG